MTYGLYTKDLSAYSLSDVSLATARKYLNDDRYVICSEKKVCNGFILTVLWHKIWRWDFWGGTAFIGPLEIHWKKRCYLMADKVVEEYHEPEEGAEKQ